MALDDYRAIVDVGRDAYLALEVRDGERPIAIRINVDGDTLELRLDDSDAGALFDALAGAIRTVIGRHAREQLEPHDTPTAP